MVYRLLADGVVLLHLAFVVFVVAGGFLIFRWPRVVWIHLPSVAWAAVLEFFGLICPLTPIENWLRERGGQSGYSGGFVEHYVMPLLYPEQLTSFHQVVLGFLVIGVNVVIYSVWLRRRRRSERAVDHRVG